MPWSAVHPHLVVNVDGEVDQAAPELEEPLARVTQEVSWYCWIASAMTVCLVRARPARSNVITGRPVDKGHRSGASCVASAAVAQLPRDREAVGCGAHRGGVAEGACREELDLVRAWASPWLAYDAALADLALQPGQGRACAAWDCSSRSRSGVPRPTGLAWPAGRP